MDFVKIGQFIAAKRKEKNLTQKELAQQLYLSEKTISKWECGKGLPEVSCILQLCKILDITANELLSGQQLTAQEVEKHTQQNIVNLLYSKGEYTLKKWSVVIIGLLSIFLLLFVVSIVSFITMPAWVKIVLLVVAFLLFFISILLLCALSNSMGNFVCKHCGHSFTPTLSAYIYGAHTLKKRYLKCPCCKKKSFCTYKSYKEQNKIE